LSRRNIFAFHDHLGVIDTLQVALAIGKLMGAHLAQRSKRLLKRRKTVIWHRTLPSIPGVLNQLIAIGS
jgi:hypothetical protein